MIALDMAIAFPIVLVTLYLMLSVLHANQSFYTAYAKSSYSGLRYYSISQQMIDVVGAEAGNYSSDVSDMKAMGMDYNASISFQNESGFDKCSGFCRVVEIDGITKIMVIT